MFISDKSETNFFDVDVIVHLRKAIGANGKYTLYAFLKTNLDQEHILLSGASRDEVDSLIEEIKQLKDR